MRGLVRLLVVGSIIFALAGCGGPLPEQQGRRGAPVAAGVPSLTTGGDIHAGEIFKGIEPTTPVTVGGLRLCVDRPGSVQLTRVEMVDGFGGIRLETFAVAQVDPNARLVDSYTDTKSIADFDVDLIETRVMEGPCPSDGAGAPTQEPRLYRLLLQYTTTKSQTAGNRGIVVWYTSAGRTKSLLVDWQILLCDKRDTTTPDCGRQ